MINESRTLELFGYTSDMLSKSSGKLIVVICDECGKERELAVHHVNYDKACGCNGVKCKLIPLSHSNHAKTNNNRPFWNKLFIYALEIDKYYYKGCD